jgi:hypothetical protein
MNQQAPTMRAELRVLFSSDLLDRIPLYRFAREDESC